ncbi:MAG TPA: family 20 glycosylhydrolase [Aridibacter sp.]|nr:family 20 glycosylhydrolase [Aridibacter sp.]
MKNITLIALFVAFAFGSGAPPASAQAAGADSVISHDLMPVPESIEFRRNVRLPVSRDFRIAFANFADERLRAAAQRTIGRLQRKTVLGLTSNSSGPVEGAFLVIETERAGAMPPRLGEDESYLLDVTSERAVLKAPTSTGILRGLETFLQLVRRDSEGFYLPGVEIRDKPRFPWRGLLIDVARHFQPMHVLKRNIDAMAAAKMNVLHWHLTEDQGFRPESKTFPKLHGLGSDGDFYTHEEMREIVDYAAQRGIRVVPEFDMPGHATSWLVGYPELGSAPGPYEIERDPGIFDPTLNPIKEGTYEFLDKFLTEMAGIFPDEYMHIGGDENEGKQWDANEEIQAFMKERGIKDNHELQTYFNKRVLEILKKNNKVMMGWDEIFQPDLPKDVVIHSWRGQEALAEAARQGYFGVLSNGYYIDLIHPASEHYLVDPIPADSTLTADEKKRVLGGEATMWSEWVSPETIDSRIWPRTAAIAERLWSPQNVRDVDDMYRRLEVMSRRLENLGLTHKKNQAMMLRRLVGSDHIGDLDILVDLVEPVKGYRRYQVRPQTMLDPLTGFIDATTPEASVRRRFAAYVSDLLAGRKVPNPENALKVEFYMWESVAEGAPLVIEGRPSLLEIRELPSALESLTEIGRQAVAYYQGEAGPPSGWKEDTLRKIDELAEPKGGVEFVFIDDLKRLVEAAAAEKEPQ